MIKIKSLLKILAGASFLAIATANAADTATHEYEIYGAQTPCSPGFTAIAKTHNAQTGMFFTRCYSVKALAQYYDYETINVEACVGGFAAKAVTHDNQAGYFFTRCTRI